jgi:hypothetical protein
VTNTDNTQGKKRGEGGGLAEGSGRRGGEGLAEGSGRRGEGVSRGQGKEMGRDE